MTVDTGFTVSLDALLNSGLQERHSARYGGGVASVAVLTRCGSSCSGCVVERIVQSCTRNLSAVRVRLVGSAGRKVTHRRQFAGISHSVQTAAVHCVTLPTPAKIYRDTKTPRELSSSSSVPSSSPNSMIQAIKSGSSSQVVSSKDQLFLRSSL